MTTTRKRVWGTLCGIILLLICVIFIDSCITYDAEVKQKLLENVEKDKEIPLIKADPKRLKSYVENVIATPKPRNCYNLKSLNMVADYIKNEFVKMSVDVEEQIFVVNNKNYRNIIGKIGKGNTKKIIVGAHYDVCGNQNGADDNASAIAGLLEMALILKSKESQLKYEIEFVAYSLEEPPHFGTKNMGSYIHAQSLSKKNEKIELMICLEMIGYFSDKENSQRYPIPILNFIYPDKGNFIAGVGKFSSRDTLKKFKSVFSVMGEIPTVTLAVPFPGVDFSDHRNYWIFGYKAIMITDTAFFRNNNYHQKTDTIETLNFDKMAKVVNGLVQFILIEII